MEEIMRAISDNRVWIMLIMLTIEIPVVVWMVWQLFKEFNRERRETHERLD